MTHPDRLLLATDLSARSDRATDRAVLASKQCNAELVAVHVLEADDSAPETSRSNEERAREVLAYDVRETQKPARIVVERGDAAERTLAVAREHECGLVVTGVARADRFFGPTLGGTVDKLVRTSDIPLLVVTERARGTYENIVVAVDFSPGSATAVTTAAHWFPKARLTLFHAFDAPPSIAVPDRARLEEQFHTVAQEGYSTFVKGLTLSTPPNVLLRRGEPELLLRQLASTRAVDLVVIATNGRGRIAEALLGSVAKRILARLACDALVVPSSP
jgi:nucleotide-binding universal stress UspA family protein